MATLPAEMQCFISYARESKERADKLYIRMRQMGLAVWMDQSPPPYAGDGIPPGVDWDAFISRRISDSAVFLPIFTKDTVEPGRYFHRELVAAFGSFSGGRNPKVIIPILSGATRAPMLEGKVDFTTFQWIDLDEIGYAETVRLIAKQASPQSAIQEIAVSTADELLQALGSNRRIALKSGDYDITAVPEKLADSPFFSQAKVHDGTQLILQNIENLTLWNAGKEKPHLYVEPSYAFPLMFRNCRNVTIEGLRIGHFPRDGSCAGGVVAMHQCSDMHVVGAELYGCGTVGFEIEGGEATTIEGCLIENCNTGFATITGTRNVSFREGIVRDNVVYFGIAMSGAENVVISRCRFEKNAGMDPAVEGRLVETNGSTNVLIEHCTFVNNGLWFDLGGDPNVRLRGNRFENSPHRGAS